MTFKTIIMNARVNELTVYGCDVDANKIISGLVLGGIPMYFANSEGLFIANPDLTKTTVGILKVVNDIHLADVILGCDTYENISYVKFTEGFVRGRFFYQKSADIMNVICKESARSKAATLKIDKSCIAYRKLIAETLSFNGDLVFVEDENGDFIKSNYRNYHTNLKKIYVNKTVYPDFLISAGKVDENYYRFIKDVNFASLNGVKMKFYKKV